jgi:hypothetical protein
VPARSRAATQFTLRQVCFDGDHALARYQAIRTDGTRFDNVEHLEFRDRRITPIDAYVGAGDGAPWAGNVSPSPTCRYSASR